ncbi:serine carboxypeptidase-like 7 isoform X1 [Malania oleifera]|uniref:serine carboxypeptidase-like 7 isoform X1 n=1 Tax=Malania oleifera TaxID=397392 RepID=UPI0025AE9168|nr:serine carboxypeptidase-like 7 isoform X1 [Malania oleifera]
MKRNKSLGASYLSKPQSIGAVVLLLLLALFPAERGVLCASSSSSSIINSIPGFSGPLPFKLQTGYVGVGENEEVQLFYYFVESEGNPGEDPLLLWFTGGPGCSGLSALVLEIGPVHFNIVDYNGSLPTWVLNPHSWSKVSSVIFLDAPVGTGFSYSRNLEGFKPGDKSMVDHGYNFLRKWLIQHPQFLENPLYIAGGSFCGLIVPIIVQQILDGNEAGHEPPINLKGYLLGNPATDVQLDENSRVMYAHNMGLISDELYESTKRSCNGDYVNVDVGNSECVKDLQAITKCTKQLNAPNILEPECVNIFKLRHEMVNEGQFLQETYEEFLLSQPPLPKVECRNYVDLLCNIWANDVAVQEALRAKGGTVRIWDRCNKGIGYVHEVWNSTAYHQNILAAGSYRALIYSGDHDLLVPYSATQSWIRSLKFSIVDDWRPWLVDSQVAGYSREYSNGLTFATVKGAGHTPAEYKPKECFAMFKRWISGEPL